MSNILIFNGSPRRQGNTSAMVQHFISGTEQNNADVEHIFIDELNLKYCSGCLRCNMIKRCSLRDDDWAEIVEKMEKADAIIFATPVYFHHVSAQLKKLIDRFRSLVTVNITEDSLKHTPNVQWQKDIVLLFSMGSSNDIDAQPAIDMFRFMFSFLMPGKEINIIKGTRLAVNKQLNMNEEELSVLYSKINLPDNLAKSDYIKNHSLAKECFELGKKLSL